MNLKEIFQSRNLDLNIVLFGASYLGKLAKYALEHRKLSVHSFYDSDERKQEKIFCEKKILNFNQLSNLPKNTIFFVSNNYINSVTALLKQMKFNNIFNCVELCENTDFSKINMDLSEYESKYIEREIMFHKSACEKIFNTGKDILNLKCIDIVVTERCSMKCKDCSNLMQYYVDPKNAELEPLFKNLDKLMECVDWVYEFRILGGEPFMNKELYKILNKLVEYKNAGNVIIYTNATIIPKKENFEVLKNKKIELEITNYGNILSRKHDELIKACGEANIKFRTKPPVGWTECGTLKYYERSKEELERMFDNCCMRDVPAMMYGVLYRCPFAANATNLKAIPFGEEEVVNLNNEKYDVETLRKKIMNFNNSNKPLTACSYCGGRDYSSKAVEPGIQIKKPLKYKTIDVRQEHKNGINEKFKQQIK